MKITKIPARNEIEKKDKWDLSSLYLTENDWEMDLTLLPDLAKEILSYKGKLSESPDTLRNALDSYCRLLMIFETTGNYAFLLTAGDAENPENQNKYGFKKYRKLISDFCGIDESLVDSIPQDISFVKGKNASKEDAELATQWYKKNR